MGANYYWDMLCTDGSGNDSHIASDLSSPAKAANSPNVTDSDVGNYFWIGFIIGYDGCNKTVNNSSDLTLWVDKDGGGYQSLALSELSSPGTGNMQYTDLTPPNSDWWTGNTSTCCANDETDGVAEDNDSVLSTGIASDSDYRKEIWFAISRVGATSGTFSFAISDSNSNLGTPGSPLVLDVTLTIADTSTTVQISNTSMTQSGQAVNVNAETKMAIAQVAMTQLAQGLTVNEQTKISIAQTSMLHSGQVLNINASTIIQIAQAAMTYAGQAVTVLANEIIQIAQATMQIVPQALVVNAKIAIQIAQTAMSFVAQALTVNARTTLQIAQTAMTYVGQTLSTGGEVIVQIAQVAMTFIAQILNVNAETKIQVAKATLTQGGQSLTVNARKIIQITQTSMAYAARVLKVNQTVKILNASLTYSCKSVTVAGAVVNQIIKKWFTTIIPALRKKGVI